MGIKTNLALSAVLAAAITFCSLPLIYAGSITEQLCSFTANFLNNEDTKTAAAVKNCKSKCDWIKKKRGLIDAAQKKVTDSCAAGIAPDIAEVGKGLDKNTQERLNKQYNQSSKMFDGTGDFAVKNFNVTSNQSPVLTAGGQVSDLKGSAPDLNKLSPVTEFSLSGTKLSGETPGQTATKQSSTLLASAASAKSPADAVASEKTAVEAQGVAASDQPEPTVECRCYYNPEDWAGGFMSPSACEEMQKIKCCPKDQHKNAAGKCVSSTSWFEGSWFEDRWEDLKTISNWGKEKAGDAWDWIKGKITPENYLSGTALAKEYLSQTGGNAESALILAQQARDKRDWESLTPEGNKLRNAENYLTAYWAVSKGQFGTVETTWLGYVLVGVPGWQAKHVVEDVYKWLNNIKNTDPASFYAYLAGIQGANDALLDKYRKPAKDKKGS